MTKNVLIIGGNSDIARNLADNLIKKNFVVIIILNKKKNLLSNDINYNIFYNDITDFAKTKKLLFKLKKIYKNINYTVINSAIIDKKKNPFSIKSSREVFELNLFANLNITLLLLKAFQNSLNKIIHISSDTSIYGSVSLPSYSSSKAAFDNFFLSLNKKYKEKITFQFIKFGPVLTTKLKRTKPKIWLKKNKKKIISIEKATKKILRLF